MAKQGMSRPDWTKTHPRSGTPPVPVIQGKAKHGKEKAKPIIAGTSGPQQKVYHTQPHAAQETEDLRLNPEARLCPKFDETSIAKFPVAPYGEMGVRVVDNCAEEHIM